MNIRNGNLALITGGTRMGEVVGATLGGRGYRLIYTWRRSKNTVEAVVARMRALGYEAVSVRCDLSDQRQIERLARELERRYGRIDVLINLAAIYERTSGNLTERAISWDKHLSFNARSAFLLTHALTPLLCKSQRARVVHIGDWTSASRRPRYPEYSAYYASKAALQAVTEALALELAPQILVNAIAPGPMIPPIGLTPKEDQEVRKATPLRRWGGADEIAKAVLFLVETDFVTGETIRVDGGRHLI
jgi:NAD(P)-dependent dehydrogenase (short-subunit alcohol dehydrogenase family)